MYYFNFTCDEINISFEQFLEELKYFDIYTFPERKEKKWTIDKSIRYLDYLKKGYPDIGIIVDVKENGSRVVLDGVERGLAIRNFGEAYIGKINKNIRIFELRGQDKEKLSFLRYYNFSGRKKNDSELRELIYGEYLEYKVLRILVEILNVISSKMNIQFLLKILSKIENDFILEDNEKIDNYLEKNMKTFEKIGDINLNFKKDIYIFISFLEKNISFYEEMLNFSTDAIKEMENISNVLQSFKKLIIDYNIQNIQNIEKIIKVKKKIEISNGVLDFELSEIERAFYTYIRRKHGRNFK